MAGSRATGVPARASCALDPRIDLASEFLRAPTRCRSPWRCPLPVWPVDMRSAGVRPAGSLAQGRTPTLRHVMRLPTRLLATTPGSSLQAGMAHRAAAATTQSAFGPEVGRRLHLWGVSCLREWAGATRQDVGLGHCRAVVVTRLARPGWLAARRPAGPTRLCRAAGLLPRRTALHRRSWTCQSRWC